MLFARLLELYREHIESLTSRFYDIQELINQGYEFTSFIVHKRAAVVGPPCNFIDSCTFSTWDCWISKLTQELHSFQSRVHQGLVVYLHLQSVMVLFRSWLKLHRSWRKRLKCAKRPKVHLSMPKQDARLSRNRPVQSTAAYDNLARKARACGFSAESTQQVPDPKTFPAGSSEAIRLAERATWLPCSKLKPCSLLDRAVNMRLCKVIDVIEVPCLRPEAVTMSDFRYHHEASPRKIRKSTLVVLEGSCRVLALFVTATTYKFLHHAAALMQEAAPVFEANYPLTVKRIQGSYGGAWGPNGSERYRGKNWLDGIQVFSSLGRTRRNHDGVYVRPYRRNREMTLKDIVKVHKTFVAVQAIERKLSGSMYRRRCSVQKGCPAGFLDVDPKHMAASAVGFSAGFCVNTHHDSTRFGICETVVWDGAGHPASFAITECSPWLVFDIGSQPCALMFMGTDEHGTMVSNGDESFHGAVLMSKVKATATTHKMQRAYEKFHKLLESNSCLDV